MRSVLLLVLATAACRDVDRDIETRAPAPATKSVEQAPAEPVAPGPAVTPKLQSDDRAAARRGPATDGDHEYVRVRSNFETTSRERLAKLDARIAELESSASESAQQTAQELRKDREELVIRLGEIRAQSKPTWDRFQADVEDSFQQVEKRLDDAVH